LPHPLSSAYQYDGTKKEKIVLTVGRWEKKDWPPKNQKTLLMAYDQFLKKRPDWSGLIVGKGASQMLKLLNLEDKIDASRITFMEHVPHTELPSLYLKSKIGFWASRWEGQQATGAQALCCGCSVVSHDSAHLSCFRHYVTRASGRLARYNEPYALARELILEAGSWDEGHRDPVMISSSWCMEFHPTHIANKALKLLNLSLN
jgi:glycosyltransferase involved in cell wall biosynthesis